MTLFQFPLEAARWMLLASIILAAWLYGGTRPWTRELISWLLIANSAVFLLGLVLRFRLPRIPAIPAAAMGFLLLQGWFMAWNAKKQFVEFAGVFVHRDPPLPGWPGFVDQGMVIPSLILVTGLLGSFAIACDMAANRIWRDRLWITIAGTGTSIVILGLAQRLTEAPSIFWDLENNLGTTFFAVFRYHANAGAFINLVLPLTVGLAIRSFQRENENAGRVLWTLAALVSAAAAFINVSRAANILSAALVLCFAVWFITARRSRKNSTSRKSLLPAGLAGLAAIVVLTFSFGLEQTVARWNQGVLKQIAPESGRVQAYRILVEESLPATGALGFGPGTFEKVFDTHRSKSTIPLQGRYDFAHSDALQTVMEWGWAGSAAWFALLGGGLMVCARNLLFHRSKEVGVLAGACGLSLAGVMIHACVDFPLQIASIQLVSICTAAMAWSLHSPKISGSRLEDALENPRYRVIMKEK